MTRGSYFCIEWSGKVSPRRCEPRGGGWEGSYDEVREESFAGNGESDCKGRRREQAWPGARHAGKVGAVRVQRGRGWLKVNGWVRTQVRSESNACACPWPSQAQLRATVGSFQTTARALQQ